MKTPMKNIINPIRVQQLYKGRNEIAKTTMSQDKSVLFPFCPFVLIAGVVNTTNAGYVGNNSIVNNFTLFQQVFTGREPIIAEWVNCNTMKQNIDKVNLDNNYWTKSFKVGDAFWGTLEQDSISSSAGDQGGMVVNSQIKTITLEVSANLEDNKNFFNSITNKMYCLWTLPKLNIFEMPNIITQPTSILAQEDREFFRISTIQIVYDSTDKLPVFATITFESVNDLYNHTGMAINQFIQLGAPGEPVCFPYWNETTNDIMIDPQLMTSKNGITHAQLSFYGNAGMSSWSFMGRQIKQDTLVFNPTTKQWDYKIEAPGHIFPINFQAPINDSLRFNSLPENSYFVLEGNSNTTPRPLIAEYTAEWKTRFTSWYNPQAGEIAQYEGLFRAVEANTIATNNETPYMPYWKQTFLNDPSKWGTDNTFNTALSPYFYTNPHTYDPNGGYLDQWLGQDKLVRNTILLGQLSNWNMFNTFLMAPFTQLPTEIVQMTPFALNDLPAIGGFLNFFGLGYMIGWTLTTGIGQGIDIPEVPCLISTSTYNFAKSIYYESGSLPDVKFSGSIALDVFKNNTSDTCQALGLNSKTTSFCASLTNQMSVSAINAKTGEKINDNTIISSKELGQVKDNTLYLMNNKSNLEQLPINNGFIIDQVTFHALTKSQYRLTFFSKTGSSFNIVDNSDMVWQGVYSTMSLMTDNIYNWQNQINLSNPLYPQGEYFPYPKQNQPFNPNTFDYVVPVNHFNESRVEIIPTLKTDTDFAFQNGGLVDLWEIFRIQLPKFTGFKATQIAFEWIVQQQFGNLLFFIEYEKPNEFAYYFPLKSFFINKNVLDIQINENHWNNSIIAEYEEVFDEETYTGGGSSNVANPYLNFDWNEKMTGVISMGSKSSNMNLTMTYNPLDNYLTLRMSAQDNKLFWGNFTISKRDGWDTDGKVNIYTNIIQPRIIVTYKSTSMKGDKNV